MGRRLYSADRLPRSIDAVVGESPLLCFDELEVRDPDDAGLVEHLLIHLSSRGTRIVVTSNQAPGELLAGSRHSRWAGGLIRRLEAHLVVCHVDDGVDYRTLGSASRFASGQVLRSPPGGLAASGLVSGGRPCRSASTAPVRCASFSALLSIPTGQQDYLLMCRAATTVGLYDVPAMVGVDADSRQRFVTLVDVAHDTDTSQDASPDRRGRLVTAPSADVSRLGLLQR